MVHELRCWYNIWQSPNLWASSVSASQTVRLSSVAHLQLKNIAKKQFVDLERRILQELDKPQSPTVPVWATFWQLIMLYRDLLGPRHQALQSPISLTPLSTSTLNPWNRYNGPYQRHDSTLRWAPAPSTRVFDRVYKVLIVHYAAYFRSNSPAYLGLKKSREMEDFFGDDHNLWAEFENVRTQRRRFRESL